MSYANKSLNEKTQTIVLEAKKAAILEMKSSICEKITQKVVSGKKNIFSNFSSLSIRIAALGISD